MAYFGDTRRPRQALVIRLPDVGGIITNLVVSEHWIVVVVLTAGRPTGCGWRQRGRRRIVVRKRIEFAGSPAGFVIRVRVVEFIGIHVDAII